MFLSPSLAKTGHARRVTLILIRRYTIHMAVPRRAGWRPRGQAAMPNKEGRQSMGSLANILWTVVVILVVLWLLGFLLNIGGGLIHLLLVIAVIVLLYNLFTGRRTV